MTPQEKALKPQAALAGRARKVLGDTAASAVIDKQIQGIKKRRASRLSEQSMGY